MRPRLAPVPKNGGYSSIMKPLLYIPFLALLGTSCTGPHITTTPVINAHSAVLNKPTKKNLQNPDGQSNSIFFTFQMAEDFTGTKFFRIDTGTEVDTSNMPVNIPCFRINCTSSSSVALCIPFASANNTPNICLEDYIPNFTQNQTAWATEGFYHYCPLLNSSNPFVCSGTFHYRPYMGGYNQGYIAGNDEGFESGYIYGYQEGESHNNQLFANGQYTGLTIFPRRHYLEVYAIDVMNGRENPENGQFYLIDTNANYTIEMKWTYDDSEKITSFYSYGDLLIGTLDWHDVAEGYWNSSWFGKYDAELHHFLDTKNYATNGPIQTSFYPEVYLGSTFTGGNPNLYFSGIGNDYQMGFADGQTYTIQASDTYNNVFSIFTPAFRAVADFFNLNIGPFKVWYFFAIPLIVTLLILVLRLVKH